MKSEAARTTFPAEPAAPGSARRLAQETLRTAGFDGGVQTAALLTTELATNAVCHTDGAFTMTVYIDGRRARVEIADSSNDLPIERFTGPEIPGGQGLRLVAAIADRWGAQRLAGGGKVVWFEIVD
jgi:hypothetical protein